MRGHRAVRVGNWHQAVAHLSEAIRIVPTNAIVVINRGLARQALRYHQLAIQDFSRAIELNPALPVAYFNRGISNKACCNFGAALADQTKAISLSPRYADAHGEQGVVHSCRHEHNLAIASFTKAMALNPNDLSHPKHRGYAHFYRGDFAAAAADLRHCLDREADPYAMLFYYLACERIAEDAEGQLRFHAGRLKSKDWPFAAIELYLGLQTPEGLVALPMRADRMGEAQFYVGQWYLLRGDRARAIEALRRARLECPPYHIEHTAAVAELDRLKTSSQEL